MLQKGQLKQKAIQIQKTRLRTQYHWTRFLEMLEEYTGVSIKDCPDLEIIIQDKLLYPNIQGEVTIKDINKWIEDLQR